MADSIFFDGDVRGPSSATDGAVAVFSGSTGKVIKVGAGGGGYVTSITGTANQITASAATGAVTLSLPSTVRIATSISVGSATNAYAAIGVGTFLDTGSGTMRGLSNVQISADTGSASFNLLKARGTPGSESVVVTGDTLGNIKGWGYDGSAYLNMGSIRMVSTGTIAANRVPTQMEFYTATNANPSVLTLALTLTSGQAATFAGTVSAPDVIAGASGTVRVGAGGSFQTNGNANTANSGDMRLQNTGIVAWRNAANDGNVTLTVNSSDILQSSGRIRSDVGFNTNGTNGVSAGPFTTITSITVVGGIVTALSGS